MTIVSPISIPKSTDGKEVRKWGESISNRIAYQKGSGCPVGQYVPRWIGDLYFDTAISYWYIATGALTTSWSDLSYNGGLVPAKLYGMVGDGATVNSSSWTNFCDAIATTNVTGWMEPGLYLVDTQISITGLSATNYGREFGIVSKADSAWPYGARIKWAGTDSSSNTMIKVQGVDNGTFKNILLDGDQKVGKCFHQSHNGSSANFAPDGWLFEKCWFLMAKGGTLDNQTWTEVAGNAAFYIDGSDNCHQNTFLNCWFYQSTTGLHISNPNSLLNSLIGCSIAYNYDGIKVVNGGSFSARNTSFALHKRADINLAINGNCLLDGCWTERSNMFMTTDFRYGSQGVTMINCSSTSYPWSHWKRGYGSQPTNDITQWATIKWDRPSSKLVLVGNNFWDPFQGNAQGYGGAPYVSEAPGVWTNYNNVTQNVVNIGTLSTTDETVSPPVVTSAILIYKIGADERRGYAIAPTSKPGFKDHGVASAWTPAQIYAWEGSIQKIVLDQNVAVNAINHGQVGEKLTIRFKQDGTGGWTLNSLPSNVNVAGGSFTLTGTANSSDNLHLEFDGTNWNEIGRAMNIS